MINVSNQRMETADHEVLRYALAWREAGLPTYLATVARTFGSSPRPVGSMAALRVDGAFAGSLSGGCLEQDLVTQLRQGEFGVDFPRVVRYGINPGEAARFGLPCGGELEIVIERVVDAAPLRELLACIDAGALVGRRVSLSTGVTSLHYHYDGPECAYDGDTLVKCFGPRWRLLLIGAGQLSRFAAEMARALDYEVFVCEPRAELADVWEVAGIQLDRRMPDDCVRALQHARTAVLALVHDPKLDDMALLEALVGPAFYVGALGSRANNDKRRARLALLGIEPAQVARLHGPVGLDIGSRTPAEIALAALAGVTAVRRKFAAPVV